MKRIRISIIYFVFQLCWFLIFFLPITGRAEGGADQISPAPVIVKEVKIKIDETTQGSRMYRDMARRLIRLKPGDSLTESKIKASVDALSLSERFAKIHVDTESDGNNETVVFTLTPFRFIRDITIGGNYPLFEKDVLNRMTIYVGDVFRPEDVAKQGDAIVELYKREGYIDPKVDVSVISGETSDNVSIGVQIEKGAPCLPGRLHFEGNQAIGVTWLKPRMKTWRFGLLMGAVRFTEDRLKKDIDNLKEYYRKQGFAEVEIDYRLNTERDYPEVDVTVIIKEGPLYKVKFKGNEYFWGHTLKKDLTLFTQGNRYDLGVRKSIRNMRQRYLKKGFTGVEIAAQSQDYRDAGVEVKKIVFDINEGPRTLVSQVEIHGNISVSKKDIDKQVLTRPPGWFHSGAFVEETLNEDIFAINTLYLNQGYQEAEVTSQTTFTPDHHKVAVAINIEEGKQTLVGTVLVRGGEVSGLDIQKKDLRLKSGQPFRANILTTDENNLSGLVSEKGYPHVIVSSKVSMNTDNTRADVIYEINPGPKVHLGEIFVGGNLKTREHVVLRELESDPDNPLSLQKLTDGQRALRDLDIFKSVQYKALGLAEKQDSVNLFVEVQENKPYYTQFSLGYDSEILYYGGAEVGNHNFMGMNRDIWAKAEIRQVGPLVEAGFAEPRLFDSRISMNTKLYFDREEEVNKTYGANELGGFVGFGRSWTDNFDTTLGFDLKQIDLFGGGEDDYDRENDPRTVLVTTPALIYDSRDSFIRPTFGWFSTFSVDISKRIEKPKVASDDFFKYNYDLRYYYTPIEHLTLAWMTRLGHIEPYGNDEPPIDQLFYLGGINNVRGFKENELRLNNDGDGMGGKTSLVGSFEARIDIGWNLDLTTFFDIGSVQNVIPNKEGIREGSDEFRSSVGLGLRYMTAIGPIGLLYGHKLEVKDGESPGRIHISIGYTF